MKKDLIKNCFNYLFLELDGLKTTACTLFVLVVCLLNNQPLLAQTNNLWTNAIETDELFIKYTGDIANYINGNKTFGAMYSIPNMEPGYRHLGSAQTIQFNGYATMLIVKPKPGKESFLKSPIDYQLAWQGEKSDHYGTPTGKKYSIWIPLAPEGYVALGVYVDDGTTKPNVNAMWCVHNSLTTKAKAGSMTLAINRDQCYSIEPTGETNGDTMHFVSGSFLPHNNTTTAYALKVKLKQDPTGYVENRVKYTPNMVSGFKTDFKVVQISYIPTVTVIKGLSPDEFKKRLRNSQLLKVVTSEAWTLLDQYSNNTSGEVSKVFTKRKEQATSTTKDISQTFGVTASAGYSSGETPGYNVNLQLSYGISWGTSTTTSSTIEETASTTKPVLPNKAVGYFQKIRRVQIFYKDEFGKAELFKSWEYITNDAYDEERSLVSGN